LEIEPTILDAFITALGAVPEVSVHVQGTEVPASNHNRLDAVVKAKVAGRDLLLLVEAKHTAFPRDVREAVWQLRVNQTKGQFGQQADEVLLFIIAEAISPGAREALRAEGVGYFDRGGSLYLPAHGAYIFVDKPPPKNEARAIGSIFTGRKAQVLQTVFLSRGDWMSVKDIATKAGVSPATVSQTFSDLERREWLDTRGSGPGKLRRLVDPGKMLDAWTRFLSDQKPKPQRHYFISAQGNDLIHRLATTCDDHMAMYAVTGEAAAQAYAPYLTSVSQVLCRMLAGASTIGTLEDLQARAVNEGWNLAVIESPSPGDFTQIETKDGVRLANPLQVYLDLQQGSGRAKELAEHLRRERLGV
jgi:hypothetical protein